MTEFLIRIAGRTIGIRAMFDSTKEFCSGYLCQGAADFCVQTDVDDILFERGKSAREDRLEGKPVLVYSDAYLETVAVQRKVMDCLFECSALLFHGSAVAVDGEGYLFTARSGTGKSTHTRLWRELLGERAVMVNDDKPVLSFDGDGVLVHGTPWNGKHRLGSNIGVPLKAVCILERGAENRIRPISAREALPVLVQQSNRPRRPQMMEKYLELIDLLTQRTAFYRLECNMEPEAARLSYETMSGTRKETKHED